MAKNCVLVDFCRYLITMKLSDYNSILYKSKLRFRSSVNKFHKHLTIVCIVSNGNQQWRATDIGICNRQTE